MTITYFRNSGEFLVSHGEHSRTIPDHNLSQLAKTQEWGDIETYLETARQNPEVPIEVDNRSRVPRPRNSVVHTIAQ